MQIVEAKNNLVKVGYDASQEVLLLSSFVVIKDVSQSFIGQIIHLESNANGNFAVAKLLFNFNDEGVITKYNGSVPALNSIMDRLQPEELLNLIPVQYPVEIGELAQQQAFLKLDKSVFEKNLLICCEKEEEEQILFKNFVSQLNSLRKKVLLIDISGKIDFNHNKIVAGKNFKLPLNYNSINFIYNSLEGANSETKALIQEVFLEVQNYVKTLPQGFIPFESFKEVVDAQYEELKLIELVLLKNRLLKYYEEGIFAQNKIDFDLLRVSLENNETTILDLSKIDEKIQREFISYTYSLLATVDKEVYVIVNIIDTNSDKKLLKQMFTTNNVYTSIFCPYSYKYLKELKQIAKNLILFAPTQQQNDFAGYNTFLNKLNYNEFIIYGHATQHLPLIVKLEEIKTGVIGNQELPMVSSEDLLDEEIRKDVDKIYQAPKIQEAEQQNLSQDDVLTEDDLDFIEEIVTEQETVEEQAENIKKQTVNNELNEETIEEGGSISAPSDIPAFEDEFSVDILPVSSSSTPIVPIYSADIEKVKEFDSFEQGDEVMHSKYGKGTVEKLITYGSKTLCSINFDNVGRRLLDPSLAEIKKN